MHESILTTCTYLRAKQRAEKRKRERKKIKRLLLVDEDKSELITISQRRSDSTLSTKH